MSEKRFRTRRQWHNTLLAVWATPFVVLIGVLFGVISGNFLPLWLLCIALAVGYTVAILRDHTKRSVYHMVNGIMILVRGDDRLEVHPADIIDASLIDRAAARDYIRVRSSARRSDHSSSKDYQSAYLRFCTVDIGLRTYTFGLGRGVIDRMPNARHDLVLLRVQKGSDLLLSPEYNQEMVDAIGRMLRRREEGVRAN
ncbi:MAG: hypothetical protein IPL52_16065 [Flavobacteriales bacterium]|nr:hypothetical protein [Flavobacteriales bacterium]